MVNDLTFQNRGSPVTMHRRRNTPPFSWWEKSISNWKEFLSLIKITWEFVRFFLFVFFPL